MPMEVIFIKKLCQIRTSARRKRKLICNDESRKKHENYIDSIAIAVEFSELGIECEMPMIDEIDAMHLRNQ